MNLTNTRLANNSESSQSFHKLTIAECKDLFKLGLITVSAYILLIVKCHGAAGWKWTFKPKDFYEEYGIKKRAFYQAVSDLKRHNLLHWETEGSMTVWHGSDIATENSAADRTSVTTLNTSSNINHTASKTAQPLPLVDSSSLPLKTCVQQNALQCSQPHSSALERTSSAVKRTPVQQNALKTPETLDTEGVQNSPDSSQIVSEKTDNKSVVAPFKKGTNINNLEFNTFVPSEDVEDTKPVIKAEPPTAPVKFKYPKQEELKEMRVNLNDTGLLAIAKKRYEEGKLAKLVKVWLDYAKKAKNIQSPTASFAACLQKEWDADTPNVEPGLPQEVNPPSEEDIAILNELKARGEIADYYFSPLDGQYKVIPFILNPNGVKIPESGIRAILWKEYLAVVTV